MAGLTLRLGLGSSEGSFTYTSEHELGRLEGWAQLSTRGLSMASACGLGFLSAWRLGSEIKGPRLRSHTASLSPSLSQVSLDSRGGDMDPISLLGRNIKNV